MLKQIFPLALDTLHSCPLVSASLHNQTTVHDGGILEEDGSREWRVDEERRR